MKTFKLHLVAEVELPSKAELIRFTDQGDATTDHIKLGGRVLRPDLIWMEYAPSPSPGDSPKTSGLDRKPASIKVSPLQLSLGLMELKDYIALAAVILSLTSLVISILSWRFAANTKGSELRASLLSVLHTALVKCETLLTDYRECKNSALDAKQIEIFKCFTKEETLLKIIEELQTTLSEVEHTSGRATIRRYDLITARATRLSVRIDDTCQDMSTIKTKILQDIKRASDSQQP